MSWLLAGCHAKRGLQFNTEVLKSGVLCPLAEWLSSRHPRPLLSGFGLDISFGASGFGLGLAKRSCLLLTSGCKTKIWIQKCSVDAPCCSVVVIRRFT